MEPLIIHEHYTFPTLTGSHGLKTSSHTDNYLISLHTMSFSAENWILIEQNFNTNTTS